MEDRSQSLPAGDAAPSTGIILETSPPPPPPASIPRAQRFPSAPAALIRRTLSIRRSQKSSAGSARQKSDDARPAASSRRHHHHHSLSSRFSSFRKSKPVVVGAGGSADLEFSGPTVGPHFNLLGDDLAVVVLSFVAYAPFEEPAHDDGDEGDDRRRLYDDYVESAAASAEGGRKTLKFDAFRPARAAASAALRGGSGDRDGLARRRLDPSSFGTLTHVLPLVSRRFRDYCVSSNALWSDATERIVLSSPEWRGAVVQWSCRSGGDGDGATEAAGNVSNDSDTISATESILGSSELPLENKRKASGDLIALAYSNFKSSDENSPGFSYAVSVPLGTNSFESDARRFFVRVANEAHNLRFSAPLFYLNGAAPPGPGEQIRLHLFEPRYQLLIDEVMKGRSDREKSGHPMSERGGGVPRPRFVYVSGISAPVVPGDPAAVVEVARCKRHRDGRANVTIVSSRRGTLLSAAQRPNSSERLIDATVMMEPRRGARERNERPPRAGHREPEPPPSTFHGPVFIMRSGAAPPLGAEMGFHLFEPRYRLMVREATEELPAAHKRGRPIPIPITDGGHEINQRPRFVWAYGPGGLSVDAPAVLVEIRRCRITANGMADVTIVPLKQARVTEFSERPHSGHLYDAEVELSV